MPGKRSSRPPTTPCRSCFWESFPWPYLAELRPKVSRELGHGCLLARSGAGLAARRYGLGALGDAIPEPNQGAAVWRGWLERRQYLGGREQAHFLQDRFRGSDLIADPVDVDKRQDPPGEYLIGAVYVTAADRVPHSAERLGEYARRDHHGAVSAGRQVTEGDRVVACQHLQAGFVPERDLAKIVVGELHRAQVR